MLLDDRVDVRAIEGWVSRYSLEEHNTERIEIRGGCRGRTLCALRREIVWGCDERCGGRAFGTGDPKVQEDRCAVISHQDILGLNIAMDVAVAMNFAERSRDAPYDSRDTFRREWYKLIERLAC